MNTFTKALYSLSLATVFCAGRIWEALVLGSILFVFLIVSERKSENKPTAQKPNLWFAGVFFILITSTAAYAMQQQTNALVVVIAYVILLVLLTRDMFKKDQAKP